MKIAHLFAGGDIGGIECLCRDYVQKSMHEHIILVMWGDGPILKELKENGIKVIYLNLSGKRLVTSFKKVKKVCHDEKVDVIVAEHEAILSHIILYLFKTFHLSVKTVIYAHCHASFMCRENEKRGLVFRKFILSNSMAKADCIIAISKCVSQSICRYFRIDGNKPQIVYNGIELDFDTQDVFLHDNENEYKNIIYIGRLIKEKGVQTIIQAIKELGDGYRLIIIGDGLYRNKLEELSIGYENNIIFRGFKNNIYDYLHNAEVFVHVPECEEGFGLTVAEAMSAGKICIVGNRGALPELITDSINGYIVESGNVEKLTKIIKYIFEDMPKEKKENMRKEARRRAEEFSIEKYVEILDMVYYKLKM